MPHYEIWKRIDELKTKPELAGIPGYEIDDLLKKSDAIDWFFLLMEQPQFTPPHDWWFELRSRCDLPWAMLLRKQPQFEHYVHWESVNRLELFKLAYMAPDIFQKKFPKARSWDLYAFLTPLEKSSLLRDLPHLENQVDWDELDQEWETGDWMMLLAYQPQFEKYFDWSRIEKSLLSTGIYFCVPSGIPKKELKNRPCPLTVLDEDGCLCGWTDEIEYEGSRYKFLIEHDSSVQDFDPFDEE